MNTNDNKTYMFGTAKNEDSFHEVESVDYQYDFRNIRNRTDPDKLEAFRQESYGMSYKETSVNADMRNMVPEHFVDEIYNLGLKENWVRANFRTVGQNLWDNFSIRLRELSYSAQILHETEEFETAKSVLDKNVFGFVKVGAQPLASFERISDSPLDELAQEILLASSKITHAELRLFSSQAINWSQGSNQRVWDNWIQGYNCTDEYGAADLSQVANIMRSIREAIISMTTRCTDAYEPNLLVFSPQVYTILWEHNIFQQAHMFGDAGTTERTGRLPRIYNLPYVVTCDLGYWDTDNSFVPTPCDIMLFSTQWSFAMRERLGLRFDNIELQSRQIRGVQIYERIMPHPILPLAYRRISPTRDYGDVMSDLTNLTVHVNQE